MNEDQVFWFLREQTDLPMELRRAIWHRHSGRWPMWRARSMKRGANQIIEVASWRNPPIGCKRHLIVWWHWNHTVNGMSWRECETLREAKEHTLSIDHSAATVRA